MTRGSDHPATPGPGPLEYWSDMTEEALRIALAGLAGWDPAQIERAWTNEPRGSAFATHQGETYKFDGGFGDWQGAYTWQKVTDAAWIIRSKDILETVRAVDQWEAWDTLRDRPMTDFGLIVTASPNDAPEDDRIGVQTEALMRRWGRVGEADQFHALAAEMGLV